MIASNVDGECQERRRGGGHRGGAGKTNCDNKNNVNFGFFTPYQTSYQKLLAHHVRMDHSYLRTSPTSSVANITNADCLLEGG